MRIRLNLYLLIVSILLMLATATVGYDMHTWRHVQAKKMAAFQRAVGGVGMGAISTPLYNFINFDPRIQPIDDSVTWPVPGIYSYGPDRTATVSYFEEIPVDQLTLK